jgi:hypothetical protein
MMATQTVAAAARVPQVIVAVFVLSCGAICEALMTAGGRSAHTFAAKRPSFMPSKRRQSDPLNAL